MLQPERRTHWEGVYAKLAVDEVSWYQRRPSVSLELIRRTGLGTGASVIDVGGGASLLVDALVEDGFERITVLDIAQQALGRAKERLGTRGAQVDWVATDVTRWAPDRRVHIWHDRALFHFLIDEADRGAYLDAMNAAVRFGGQVIIGTFAPDGPERCSGLPVMRYDAAALGETLGREYRLRETIMDDHLTPKGKVQRFQFCRFLRT